MITRQGKGRNGVGNFEAEYQLCHSNTPMERWIIFKLQQVIPIYDHCQ